MTDSPAAQHRPSKNERRAEARDKARQLREEQQKKERKQKLLLQGGVALAVVAIIAIIAVVLVNSVRPAGPGPRNMASDGFKLDVGLVPVSTPALAIDDTPITSEANAPGVVDIQLYVDYLCPICGEFEEVNGPLITTLVESGAATVEIRPIAILTGRSAGTQYSIRSANLAACVANYSPDAFYDVHTALFTAQPEEGTPGLDDDELLSIATAAGASSASIETCVREQQFKSWVLAATDRATNGPLAVQNAAIEKVAGTPTVLVNGQLFEYGPLPFVQSEFSQFVLQAAGDEFSTNPSPSPSPSLDQ